MEEKNEFTFIKKDNMVELIRTKSYKTNKQRAELMKIKLQESIDNYKKETVAIDVALKNNPEAEEYTIQVPFVNSFTFPQYLNAQNNTRNQLLEAKQRAKQLEAQIEQDVLVKQLEDVKKGIEEQEGIIENNRQLEDEVKEIVVTKIKKLVRKEKSKKGYERITDTNDKLNMMNHILGPITNDLGIDINDPLIIRLKREFDKI